MDAPALSERQTKILAFIRLYRDLHGYPPSFREIGKSVGLRSADAVRYQLQLLQVADRLRLTPGVARSIVLIERVSEGVTP